MWIVLLDHSSSMGQAFENRQAADRLATETRLAAAKSALLTQLSRLPPSTPVALFAFTSTARHLLTAHAHESEQFRSALKLLEPENDTDIAQALNAAANHVVGLAKRPRVRGALLISDGESDPASALAAAARCHKLGIRVDALFIGPDRESQHVASRITRLTGGRLHEALSADQLDARTSGIANTVARAHSRRPRSSPSRRALIGGGAALGALAAAGLAPVIGVAPAAVAGVSVVAAGVAAPALAAGAAAAASAAGGWVVAKASIAAGFLSTLLSTRSIEAKLAPRAPLVRFSAGYPELIWPRRTYRLDVYAHSITLDDTVMALLKDDQRHQANAHPRLRSTPASSVLLGQEIRIESMCSGLAISPRSRCFKWNGHLYRASFDLMLDSGEYGPDFSGSIKIFVASLPTYAIPMQMTVQYSTLIDSERTQKTSDAKAEQILFVSYSRKDRRIVRACANVYTALGHDVRADFKFS